MDETWSSAKTPTRPLYDLAVSSSTLARNQIVSTEKSAVVGNTTVIRLRELHDLRERVSQNDIP